MKENSIEEDMIILGAFNLAPSLRHISETEFKDVQRALDNILSDYKRVLKENEELKNDYENLNNSVVVKNYCIKNSIPIQKIKDKIEELNQYYKKEIHPSLYQWADITITEHYDEMIELLQELLEGGENG